MKVSKSIEELLAKAKNGHQEAENELFSKLRARILNSVQYKLLNVRKHHSEVAKDVEDIVEETMLTMLQKYKTEELPYGFMAWVNKIVWNKVGDYIRYGKIKTKEVRIDDTGMEIIIDQNTLPEDEVLPKELDEIIGRALKRLSPYCKEYFEALLKGEERAFTAARKKEEPEGTIDNRNLRCRKRFMKLLIEEGFEV